MSGRLSHRPRCTCSTFYSTLIMNETNHVVINEKTYQVIESSEVIEADAKVGKKYWRGHIVRNDNNEYFTATTSWQDTKDGLSVITWSAPYYAKPKNVGKANETTSESQAKLEFESMVKKEKRIRNSERPLPMLAKVYQDHKHKIKYPCAIQPKLDGNRMLYNGEEEWSRKNKRMNEKDDRILEHILPFDTGGFPFDGELMLSWMPKVNITNSAIKKYNENTPHLKYYVYDIIDPNRSFKDRYEYLRWLVTTNKYPNVVLVQTHICESEEDVKKWHKFFVEQGYEGSIVRNLDAKYAINRRVDDVQKLKDFITEEFEIVDLVPAGGGSSADVGKFICRANNGELFESTATGTEDERRELLINKDKYIGMYAVVKYRELSGLNSVPFHSNVLEIRETKDQGY